MVRLSSVLIGGLCAALLGMSAYAQAAASSAAADYPKQPIQIVVPFPPGGNTDLIARILADRLQAAFKSPVVVVSRPGAGTNIGAAFVANSKPDGYTMLISAPASFVVNQFIYSKLSYDPDTSFAPVSVAAEFPNVLVVPPSLGVKSIARLIEKAKAQPGKVTYASAGIGTSSHLADALFAQMAGVNMLHVPYKGTSQSLQDLIPGRVDMTIDNLGPILPFIKSGQLIALGVSTKDPVSLLPGVPPIELGTQGLRAELLECAGDAGRHSGRYCREGQRRMRPHPSHARRGRKDQLVRLAACRRHPRADCRLLERGAGPLGERHRGGKHQERAIRLSRKGLKQTDG